MLRLRAAFILAVLPALACSPSGDANSDGLLGHSAASAGSGTGAGDGDRSEQEGGSGEGGASGAAEGSGEGGSSSSSSGGTPDLPTDPNEMIPPVDAEGCHAIYAQDHLPTFELELSDAVWAALQSDWNNGVARIEAGANPKEYRPIESFRYEGVEIDDAAIRLRGNPLFWDPIPDDKMQFQIGFHREDKDGRFLGLKRILFDSATFNRHLLRDRLALSIMREAGIKAPCANNARLVINGEYYGIFTNIEKVDRRFLDRNFEEGGGDLWKRADWELKTNSDGATDTHLRELRNATTLADMEANLNVAAALRIFASDAVLPNSDGPWAGGLNFYLYDDPTSGVFEMIPWDLDNTFERFSHEPDGDYPQNPDPIVWEKPSTHGRPWYDLALGNPNWHASYISAIEDIRDNHYVPARLHERINTWTEQIRDAVESDENKPYSNSLYDKKLRDLHEHIDRRAAFLDDWLGCWERGGSSDAEGYCVE